MISKKELFGKLALGHAERITVVTPNRRLSQALVCDFDAYQARQGKTVWEAADILPYGSFVERLYEDALYSPPGEAPAPELPMLLTAAQEQWVWTQAIASSRQAAELLEQEVRAKAGAEHAEPQRDIVAAVRDEPQQRDQRHRADAARHQQIRARGHRSPVEPLVNPVRDPLIKPAVISTGIVLARFDASAQGSR